MYLEGFNGWTTDLNQYSSYDEPFYIEDLPLADNVYVLDNYLAPNLHRALDDYLSHCSWQKTNEVKGGDGSWNT